MLTARMPQEVIEALGDFARDREVSRSEALKRIVSEHLTAKGYLK
ncbi:ribbon-helix-helix protein, CopG family [Methylobacterium sp. J-076]|nr:ribbon-helix-helix protein, CopG family [Methylobacterium sp. J-076]MCJ2014317.1 ribbon-helix-helix protein, CopG family [Methylobacterium sp. J-076]